jgi:hypothetical protein
MGGQACVLYGAAQFSRDTDIAIALDPDNLDALKLALDDLQARCIAVPPFEVDFLRRGMAIHFRCQHPDAEDIRIDVMNVMRGVAPFDELWSRRTTLEFDDGLKVDLLSLPDLVQAKKTQRDKDWPMLRLLIEAHYKEHATSPNEEQVRFWLREARTVSILQTVAKQFPAFLSEAALQRPLLVDIGSAPADGVERALHEEELRERDADRRYWAPRSKELEQIRLGRRHE